MPMQWAPVEGRFRFEDTHVVFRGGQKQYGDEVGSEIGLAMCDQTFSGGTISADVTFSELEPKSLASIIFWYHPERRYFVSASIARDPQAMFGIWHFDTRWNVHTATGDGGNLEAGRKYRLQVQLRGSRAALSVDGVQVAAASLPFSLPPSQVGLWFRSLHDITVENFIVTSETPRVFVVMQFASPFNELHREVLKTVCNEFGFEAVRADETYGPGLIIADIVKQIQESKFVIAEITPPNPNVYFEVGYAHAINKPTILLAQRPPANLPFDVSSFRMLFYENTIAGKSQVEEGLRRHIRAVLATPSF